MVTREGRFRADRAARMRPLGARERRPDRMPYTVIGWSELVVMRHYFHSWRIMDTPSVYGLSSLSTEPRLEDDVSASSSTGTPWVAVTVGHRRCRR